MPEKSTKEGTFEKLTPILLVATVILAFAVGILWQKVSTLEGGKVEGVAQPADVVPPPADGKLTEDQVKNIVPISDEDHIKGNKDAKVILIEYSDLECPYCSTFHATAQQLKDEYGDDIAWVYRHFPLEFHDRARPAAIASECAAEKGGDESFWAFIGGVFADQTTNLTDAGLKKVAANIGLDASEFANCLEAGNNDEKVENQYQGGMAAGVNGTPGNIILNDKGEAWLIPGALPFDSMKQAIDVALQSQ
ncbi:DsbA family protein [Patescibacteria group bacterium]|nr:DsbA family protein [Patescibacteria group bacterium]MBU0777445.1 DsbA family protein [Patescibacteria group bacterium]MBU0846080.1 DsbA family protein [Patescibacteria group bacterium]MBU0923133.1 DsbA family protein [Patescibacteria group bacterium]MBU1066848.1 DsbA family protein [Patescibacteria group bacterium]